MNMNKSTFSYPNELQEDNEGESMQTKMSYSGSKKSEESPLMTFVFPLFKCLRWIFFTHSRFEFDRATCEYRHYPGSILRKVLCVLVQIVTMLFIVMEMKTLATLLGTVSVKFMYRLLSVAYFSFNISFFHALMTKGGEVVDIFNFVQDTTTVVRKAGCKIPREKMIRFLLAGLLVVYLFFAVVFVALRIDGVGGASITNGTLVHFNTVADYNTKRFQLAFDLKSVSELQSHSFSGENSQSLVVVVAIFTWIVSILATFSWLSAFLMLTLWGFLFWKVLHNFFHIVAKCSVRNTLDDIRRFNSITGLVDHFNRAFGWVIFLAVIAGSAHLSVFIIELFKEGQDVWTRVMIATNVFIFGLTLLTAAQVNQAAADIVEIIKMRFQMETVWQEFHGCCNETTQGMVLVLHETQSNKIGFRGLGFFTVTYSFIGTVLSIISTYAVVVMQLQAK